MRFTQQSPNYTLILSTTAANTGGETRHKMEDFGRKLEKQGTRLGNAGGKEDKNGGKGTGPD